MPVVTVRADEVQANDEVDSLPGEVVAYAMVTKAPHLILAPNAKNTHARIVTYQGTTINLYRDTMLTVRRP